MPSRSWGREINVGINPLRNLNLFSNLQRLICQRLTHLVPLAGQPESEPAVLEGLSSSGWFPKGCVEHEDLEQSSKYLANRKPALGI